MKKQKYEDGMMNDETQAAVDVPSEPELKTDEEIVADTAELFLRTYEAGAWIPMTRDRLARMRGALDRFRARLAVLRTS